jgi:hypothetical protein
MKPLTTYKLKPVYGYATVIFDGQVIECTYESYEGEFWLVGAKLGNVELIEWLNESTINSIEALIEEAKKELIADFIIWQAA